MTGMQAVVVRNVHFIDHLPPVLLLHVVLFPVNLLRLYELLAPKGTGNISLPDLAPTAKTPSAETGRVDISFSRAG